MLSCNEPPTTCRLCAGPLSPLVTIPDRPEKYEQDHRRIVYLQCEQCAQVLIEDR